MPWISRSVRVLEDGRGRARSACPRCSRSCSRRGCRSGAGRSSNSISSNSAWPSPNATLPSVWSSAWTGLMIRPGVDARRGSAARRPCRSRGRPRPRRAPAAWCQCTAADALAGLGVEAALDANAPVAEQVAAARRAAPRRRTSSARSGEPLAADRAVDELQVGGGDLQQLGRQRRAAASAIVVASRRRPRVPIAWVERLELVCWSYGVTSVSTVRDRDALDRDRRAVSAAMIASAVCEPWPISTELVRTFRLPSSLSLADGSRRGRRDRALDDAATGPWPGPSQPSRSARSPASPSRSRPAAVVEQLARSGSRRATSPVANVWPSSSRFLRAQLVRVHARAARRSCPSASRRPRPPARSP